MAAIAVSYTFTPAITGGSVTATGNSESEIKTAIKAALQLRKDVETAALTNLNTALTEMDA